MAKDWETLDTQEALRRQQEQTTTAGVGGYTGPAFGPSVFRREPLPSVTLPVTKKRKKKDR